MKKENSIPQFKLIDGGQNSQGQQPSENLNEQDDLKNRLKENLERRLNQERQKEKYEKTPLEKALEDSFNAQAKKKQKFKLKRQNIIIRKTTELIYKLHLTSLYGIVIMAMAFVASHSVGLNFAISVLRADVVGALVLGVLTIFLRLLPVFVLFITFKMNGKLQRDLFVIAVIFFVILLSYRFAELGVFLGNKYLYS